MNTSKQKGKSLRWVLRSTYDDRDGFIINLKSKHNNTSKFILIDGDCSTLTQLYDTLEECFNFPDYFGRNFAALKDCLLDGDIVPYVELYIVFSDGKSLLSDEPQEVLCGLLETLDLVGEEWAKGGSWPWNFPPRSFYTVINTSLGDRRYEALPSVP